MMNKHQDTDSFNDNLFEAYTLLEQGDDQSGVWGADFMKIVTMLCIQYPHFISKEILFQVEKEEEMMEFD